MARRLLNKGVSLQYVRIRQSRQSVGRPLAAGIGAVRKSGASRQQKAFRIDTETHDDPVILAGRETIRRPILDL